MCVCARVFITVVRKKRKNHHDLLKYNINELITLVTVSLNLDSVFTSHLGEPDFANVCYVFKYLYQKIHSSKQASQQLI